MSKIILAAVYLGGVTFGVGLVGGATGTLSDYLPLILAASGVGLMYLVLIAVGLIDPGSQGARARRRAKMDE